MADIHVIPSFSHVAGNLAALIWIQAHREVGAASVEPIGVWQFRVRCDDPRAAADAAHRAFEGREDAPRVETTILADALIVTIDAGRKAWPTSQGDNGKQERPHPPAPDGRGTFSGGGGMTYILDGKVPVAETDTVKWATWFESASRRVAQDRIGESFVSTVFAAYAIDVGGLFETLVIGGPLAGECEHYASWDEAEAGHARMVERVREVSGGAE